MGERGGSGGSGGGSPPKDDPLRRRPDLGADLRAALGKDDDLAGDWASQLSADLDVEPNHGSVVIDGEPPVDRSSDLRAELRGGAARPPVGPRGEIGVQRVDMRALLEGDPPPIVEPPAIDMRALLNPQGAAIPVDEEPPVPGEVQVDMRALLEGAPPKPAFEPTSRIDRELARDPNVLTARLEREGRVVRDALEPGAPREPDTDGRVRALNEASDSGGVSVVPVSDEAAAAGPPPEPVRAPGFVDGPVPKAADPWTDVTPAEAEGEGALLERDDARSTDVVRAYGDAPGLGPETSTLDMTLDAGTRAAVASAEAKRLEASLVEGQRIREAEAASAQRIRDALAAAEARAAKATRATKNPRATGELRARTGEHAAIDPNDPSTVRTIEETRDGFADPRARGTAELRARGELRAPEPDLEARDPRASERSTELRGERGPELRGSDRSSELRTSERSPELRTSDRSPELRTSERSAELRTSDRSPELRASERSSELRASELRSPEPRSTAELRTGLLRDQLRGTELGPASDPPRDFLGESHDTFAGPDPMRPPDEVETGDLAAEDPYAGDGPFAAPVDAPPARPKLPRRTVSEIARQGIANAFSAPLVVQRRTGRSASQTGSRALVPTRDPAAEETTIAPVAPRSRAASQAGRPAGERRYPKMRALLADPEAVPHGIAAPSKPRPPPVPGTFFPAPRKELNPTPVPAEPADLDEMLLTMAEGLLIGEDASGQTEVRVTLRDEFFAGTELRIVAGGGRVRAVLVPPDRTTYLTLNGNLDDLRLRLEARGLHIEELRVAEP